MAKTTYIDFTTPIAAEWLNEVNVAIFDLLGNGTNAPTTKAAVRTNLGLEIGTDVQAYDAALASIAGLTTAADKMIYTTGSDTYAVADLSSFGRSLLDDADAPTARTTLGAQAADADLDDLAAIDPTADDFIMSTGTVWEGATAQEVANVVNPLLTGRRNIIINGDMRIDQRHNGAAITVNSGTKHRSIDSWYGLGTASAGTFTLQRTASNNPRHGYELTFDVGTADTSLAAGDIYILTYAGVEGFDFAAAKWGTAAARPVTLSFEVFSSKTGVFPVAFRNADTTRSYVTTVTIDAANTWEKKTVTIPGDTTGTWNKDSNSGLNVTFTFAAGTTYQTTAGAWAAGNYVSVSAGTNFMDNAANIMKITGVQLEHGSVATPFEHRSMAEELTLCRRYFRRYGNTGGIVRQLAIVFGTSFIGFDLVRPEEMRAAPTMTNSAPSFVAGFPSGNQIAVYDNGFATISGALTFSSAFPAIYAVAGTSFGGVTVGNAATVYIGSACYFDFSAEF